MCALVLTTAGNLAFAGEPSRKLDALNVETGELLWRFQCGGGDNSSATT